MTAPADFREPLKTVEVVSYEGWPAILISGPGNEYEAAGVEIIKLEPAIAASIGRELIRLAGEA